MLQPALQMTSCHLRCPPPVWELQQESWTAGETAHQTEWSQRAISSYTVGYRQRHILVRSVKNRSQDGKGDMTLGGHLADAIRLHIDRQCS